MENSESFFALFIRKYPGRTGAPYRRKIPLKPPVFSGKQRGFWLTNICGKSNITIYAKGVFLPSNKGVGYLFEGKVRGRSDIAATLFGNEDTFFGEC